MILVVLDANQHAVTSPAGEAKRPGKASGAPVELQLWRRDGRERSWQRVVVPTEGLSFQLGEKRAIELREGSAPGALARIVPFEENGSQRAALLTTPPGSASARVLVNAQRALELCILAERDEILVEGEAFYFTTRGDVLPMSFPAGEEMICCARCGQRLRPGDVVIQCPGCRQLHHEGPVEGTGDAVRCWSHSSRCGACAREHEALLWSPEDFDA